MRAGIVVIGDELLDGHTQDANTHRLAGWLGVLGIEPFEVRLVRDDVTAITGAVFELHERRDCALVITTGGLGPTHDDITVAAIARMHGVGLELDPTTWARFEARAVAAHEAGRRDSDVVDPAARKMAMVPRGALVFQNGAGAAPGLAMPWGTGGWTLVAPGVPQELQRLWEDHFESFVRQFVGDDGRRRIVREHVVRGYESRIADRLSGVALRHPDVLIGSYPQWGEGRLVLRVSGLDAAVVAAAFDELVAVLRETDSQEGL